MVVAQDIGRWSCTIFRQECGRGCWCGCSRCRRRTVFASDELPLVCLKMAIIGKIWEYDTIKLGSKPFDSSQSSRWVTEFPKVRNHLCWDSFTIVVCSFPIHTCLSHTTCYIFPTNQLSVKARLLSVLDSLGRMQPRQGKSICAYVVVLGWWFGSLGIDDFVSLEKYQIKKTDLKQQWLLPD